MPDLLDDLTARGLVADTTDRAALERRLAAGPVTLYCGFDPTADSLHVGSLVPLLLLRRFQDAGHRIMPLAGGATGMIGDPSGRSAERNLLEGAELDANLAAITAQLARFVSFAEDDPTRPPARIVDNRDWTVGVDVLAFLRDVGKHVTVGTMLGKESVRARIGSDQGLSFTEFSYMLLQANDFYELHERHGCELQVGGSDQWGNITAGIDLIRRRSGASVHGLTVPLMTRADGAKFGKTADGAVWLDAGKTLPYEMFQYFVNVDDRDVERYLLQLTLLPVDTVTEIIAGHEDDPAARAAQRRLASEVVTLVHGAAAAEASGEAADVLFGRGKVTPSSLGALRGVVPESSVDASVIASGSLVELLVDTGVASSRGDARRTLGQNGISVNGEKRPDDVLGTGDLVDGRFVLLQKGRKTRHLVVVEGL